MVLVGCKSDLKDNGGITTDMIEKVKNSTLAHFYEFAECSALNLDGIDDVFYTAA